jgi:hypothetical protein
MIARSDASAVPTSPTPRARSVKSKRACASASEADAALGDPNATNAMATRATCRYSGGTSKADAALDDERVAIGAVCPD